MTIFPLDCLEAIAFCLDPLSLLAFSLVCKAWSEVTSPHGFVWKHKLFLRLKAIGYELEIQTVHDIFIGNRNVTYRDLCFQISPTPTIFDYTIFPQDIVSPPFSSFRTVQYIGQALLGNRSIRTDLPILPRSTSNLHQFPFTSVLKKEKNCKTTYKRTDRSNFVYELSLSMVAYFEVEIGSHPSGLAASPDECVVIGFSNPDFHLNSSLPGWDYKSWGYHGDDG